MKDLKSHFYRGRPQNSMIQDAYLYAKGLYIPRAASSGLANRRPVPAPLGMLLIYATHYLILPSAFTYKDTASALLKDFDRLAKGCELCRERLHLSEIPIDMGPYSFENLNPAELSIDGHYFARLTTVLTERLAFFLPNNPHGVWDLPFAEPTIDPAFQAFLVEMERAISDDKFANQGFWDGKIR